ncbi:MAG TPA: hypothetical protein VF406_15020, partial [Thermodesulfobacteriota bacterium]
MASLEHVDLGDRAVVKSALRSTLVKKADQIPTFDALFDVFFSAPGTGSGSGQGETPGGGTGRATEGRRSSGQPPTDGGSGVPRPGDASGARPLVDLLEADPEAAERALAAAGRRARIDQVTSRIQVP